MFCILIDSWKQRWEFYLATRSDDDGESKPPNLKADDDGEFFGWDEDGKEITDQNGVDLSKKRSNRLASGGQNCHYPVCRNI